jgi:predicted DNA-binding transcriptional regulator AlpA
MAVAKHNEDEWLVSSQIKAMFHFSDMALWRWQQDEKLGFPKPRKIMRRNYWIKSEIDAFNARVIRESAAPKKK